jgi:hypothetical protein
LLAGYAAGEMLITASMIEDVAETFDMLPRTALGTKVTEDKVASRIFSSAGSMESNSGES